MAADAAAAARPPLAGARPALAAALVVTRRELRDQMRDWRIITPIVLLTLIFPLLMNFTANQAVDFVARYGADIVAERLFPFLLMVVGFFPISVSLVIALETFVGEKERHSLEPLLSSPLTDTQLYVGKMLAAMIAPLAGAYLGIGVYLASLYWSIGWVAEPILLVQILAMTTIQAVVMVAGAVVISSQTTSVRAANLLASFIIVPMALLVQGESLVMFWGRYDVLWWVILGLFLLTLVLVRMGVRLFNREELLGRDIDEMNLRAAWRTFAAAFVGQGRGGGLVGWYTREVFPTLRRLRGPIAAAALALLAALAVGYYYSIVYPLPLNMVDRTGIVGSFGATMEQYGLTSPSGSVFVFLINLRAIALAAAAAAFSLGVLGLVLLMTPLALTGFFAGQVASLGIHPLQFFAVFILPHGMFEITAALLQAAVILRLGASVLTPAGGQSLGSGWLRALADWAKVTLGVVLPLLVLGALAEVFITPYVVIAALGAF